MSNQELIYGYSSLLVATVLFITMIVCNEVGYRVGCFVQSRSDQEVKSLTGSIQASILGLLALLLGFTFNMSMQRFDDRSLALIDEANAIGTLILRTQLLPQEYQAQATSLLEEYVKLRVDVGRLDLTKLEERNRYGQSTENIQDELWQLAVSATNTDPRPVTTGAFVASLNDVIDRQGKRNSLQQMHVPEVVLILLFIIFISSGAMMGYSAGLSNRRILLPITVVSLLVTLIVFIIIDLDRPKRGLIQVDQTAIVELL